MSAALTDILFRPFSLGSLAISNRIVMAPMTRLAAPDGVVGAANAAYYRCRALGGAGLILSEGTVVDRPAARHDPAIPFFHGAGPLSGWKKVLDEVHGAGARMGPQLWHVGAVRGQGGWVSEAPVESPSGLYAPHEPLGVAMDEQAIADTIAAFAKAAANARNLGFDVVELHGAHGYLIDQFFWHATNVRDDCYGGSTIAERSRFAAEVVAAVRVAVGPAFPIILRISQWKQQDYAARLVETPGELAKWLSPLADAGVDMFHCSQRRFWEPEFPEVDGAGGLNLAGWTKKLTGVPTISVGSVGLDGEFLAAFKGQAAAAVGIDELLRRMERDEFDLIAVGRALIADPYWPMKVRNEMFDQMVNFDPAALAALV